MREILNIYVILTFAISYFICSINPAILICKKKTGQDIRKLGSGNAGSANAMRVLGKLLGTVVVVLDIIKVLLSYFLIYLIVYKLFKQNIVGYIMSAFIIGALFGHCFPIYYGFRGGKGVIVATTIAVILNYKYAIVCIIVSALVYIITKIPSASSLSGILLYLIMIIVMSFEYTVPVALVTFIILFKHRSNIKRIFERQERIFKI